MSNQELVQQLQQETGANKEQLLQAAEVLYEQNRAHEHAAVSQKEKA